MLRVLVLMLRVLMLRIPDKQKTKQGRRLRHAVGGNVSIVKYPHRVCGAVVV